MNITFTRLYCNEAYGLNKYRSLISVEHDLSIEDLSEFAYEIIYDLNCFDAAVFAHSLDNIMYAFIYNYEMDCIECITCNKFDPDFFSKVDAEYLCSFYCLLVETENGLWRVVDG